MNRYDYKMFDDDGRQTIWNASSITALQKCKRYYYYTILQGWRSKTASADLAFGGLFASSIEYFYKHRDPDYESTLNNTIMFAMRNSKYYSKQFPSEEVKTRKALITALVEYFDQYYELDGPSVWRTEQSFLFDTNNLTFCGRLDLVLKRDDELILLDQKTTKSSLSPMYFKTWTPNNQMSLYMLAAYIVFNKPAARFLIDAVQVMKNGSVKMMRGVVSRGKDQLDEWLNGVTLEIEAVKDKDPHNEADWPQNPSACGYFQGCEFREVCSISPAMRKAYLTEALPPSQQTFVREVRD